jgi:hypothetical protein
MQMVFIPAAETKAAVKRYKNTTLEPKDLSFEELQQMTNDFSQSQEISRGELGVVYKVLLSVVTIFFKKSICSQYL